MPTLTLTVSEEIIRQIEDEAKATGRAPDDYARECLATALQLSLKRLAPNSVWVDNEPIYVPPKQAPYWLSQLQPTSDASLQSVVGQWPGEETEEELAHALEQLS